MQGKIKESFNALFGSVYSKPSTDRLIMSADAFDEYKSALMHQEVE